MGGRAVVILLVALLAGACGPASTSSTPGVPGPSVPPPSDAGSAVIAGTRAQAYLDALARGDWAAAEAMQDPTMTKAAPAEALGQLWAQLEGQFGAFRGTGEASAEDKPPFVNVTIEGLFEKATVPLIVTVDADGRIAGFHLGQPGPPASAGPAGSAGPGVSSSPPASASPAAYVRPDAFTESPVTVGSAPWTLPGTLSMPKGAGPFPAVVLLAGSGPQDRDETIGPNAPLRDLAWGLASNGVAVLRYDKRTKVYGPQMAADAANVTVKEETTDDALAAVDLLRATPGVDPARVFVVGHSLGGYLAPRIAAQAGDHVAGIGMLEANTTPLEDLILEQVRYLAGVSAGGASPDPATQAKLDQLAAQVALAKSPTLSPSTPASELPLGIPAAYWLDLRTYDPLATVRSLAIPVFISQGGRDYQVPPSELAAWRTALAGRADASIHEYPALNHLLMAGTGPSLPSEYTVPGHVAPEVVADLAAWVLAQGG